MSPEQRTLLAVLAHPDDESFGVGGTLALYAARGVQVHLLCATRGEAGVVDEEHLNNHNSVAEVRVEELRCAAQILGLAGVHFLDYRDSGMSGSPDNQHPRALARAPQHEVARQIAGHIRRLKPQVVITFDPIGGYHHPDHIAVHQATVQAFEMASDPAFQDGLPPHRPAKLYFHTLPRRALRWAVRLMPLFGKDPHRWGRNQDIDLTRLVDQDFSVHAVIDYQAVRERKAQASACHASQGGSGMLRGLMGWMVRLGGRRDSYMRAYPPPADGLRRERDLFE